MDKRASGSSIEEINLSGDSSIELETEGSIEDPDSAVAGLESDEEDKCEKRAPTSKRQIRLPAKLRDPEFVLNKSVDSLEVEMRDSKIHSLSPIVLFIARCVTIVLDQKISMGKH